CGDVVQALQRLSRICRERFTTAARHFPAPEEASVTLAKRTRAPLDPLCQRGRALRRARGELCTRGKALPHTSEGARARGGSGAGRVGGIGQRRDALSRTEAPASLALVVSYTVVILLG